MTIVDLDLKVQMNNKKTFIQSILGAKSKWQSQKIYHFSEKVILSDDFAVFVKNMLRCKYILEGNIFKHWLEFEQIFKLNHLENLMEPEFAWYLQIGIDSFVNKWIMLNSIRHFNSKLVSISKRKKLHLQIQKHK